MDKILKIELTAIIVLIGFFIAVVFHYILGFYYHVPYPLNTFLFVGNPFSDFYNDYLSAQHLMPYISSQLSTQSFPVYMATNTFSAYLPISYLLIYPFTFISPQDSALFHGLFFIACMGLFTQYYLNYGLPEHYKVLNRLLTAKNIFIFSAMTYPVLFSFERGNDECLLFILLVGFLFFYLKGNYLKSGLFLAIAVGMKMYPAVFFVLFFADKQYKAAGVCIVLTAALTFLSLLIYKGSMAHQLHVLTNNLDLFKFRFINSSLALQANTSYFSVFETLYRIKNHIPFQIKDPQSAAALRNYALLACLFFFCISLYIIKIEKTVWKKIALLTACMILLPYISFDYKLLQIYLPFFIFVNTQTQTEKNIQRKFSLMNVLYTIIFALLFIPKNYYLVYWHGSIGSMINTALLTLLVFLIVGEGCAASIQLINPIKQTTPDF